MSDVRKITALPKSQYLAALRRRTTPTSRQRFRQHFAASHPKHSRPSSPAASQPDLTAPLTPKLLNSQVNAAAKLRYGPQQAELKKQQGISALQQRRIPEFYADYQNRIAALAQQAQANATAAAQAAATRTQATQGADQQRMADLSAQERADAALRGTTPSNQIQATAQQAATSRQANADLVASLAAQRAAGDQTFFGARQLAGQQAQAQALQKERDFAGGLSQKNRDLLDAIGAFKTDTRQKLTQAERDYALNLQVAGGNQAYKDAQLKLAGARIKTTRHGQDQTHADRMAALKAKGQNVNKYGFTNDQWQGFSTSHRQRVIKAFQKSGGKSGKGPNASTPDQRRTNRRSWSSMVSLVQAQRNNTLAVDPLTGQPTGLPKPGDQNYELYIIAKHYIGNKKTFLPGDIKRLKRNWPGVV